MKQFIFGFLPIPYCLGKTQFFLLLILGKTQFFPPVFLLCFYIHTLKTLLLTLLVTTCMEVPLTTSKTLYDTSYLTQFNSILYCISRGSKYQTPQVEGLVPQDCPPPSMEMPVVTQIITGASVQPVNTSEAPATFLGSV